MKTITYEFDKKINIKDIFESDIFKRIDLLKKQHVRGENIYYYGDGYLFFYGSVDKKMFCLEIYEKKIILIHNAKSELANLEKNLYTTIKKWEKE